MNETDRHNVSEDARRADESRIAMLEDNERQLIALVVAGRKDRQISESLQISEKSIREQLNTIFNKLGVSDRFELVLYAHYHHLAGTSH